MENTIENAIAFYLERKSSTLTPFITKSIAQIMVDYHNSVRPEVVVPSEAESIVNALVEWSLAYPRDRVYHVSKMSMDNELIALEERAKKYFTELNHEK